MSWFHFVSEKRFNLQSFLFRRYILGVNDVKCRRNRVMEWAIPVGERVSVQPGDYVGVADLFGGSSMYGFCDDITNYGYLEYNFVDNSAIRPGRTLATDSNSRRCVVVPINAEIGP